MCTGRLHGRHALAGCVTSSPPPPTCSGPPSPYMCWTRTMTWTSPRWRWPMQPTLCGCSLRGRTSWEATRTAEQVRGVSGRCAGGASVHDAVIFASISQWSTWCTLSFAHTRPCLPACPPSRAYSRHADCHGAGELGQGGGPGAGHGHPSARPGALSWNWLLMTVQECNQRGAVATTWRIRHQCCAWCACASEQQWPVHKPAD